MSTKASEKLNELSVDTSLKNSFTLTQLTKLLFSVANNYLFITSYICNYEFSAMVNIYMWTKYGNKLNISNSLRLKVNNVEIEAKTIEEK